MQVVQSTGEIMMRCLLCCRRSNQDPAASGFIQIQDPKIWQVKDSKVIIGTVHDANDDSK